MDRQETISIVEQLFLQHKDEIYRHALFTLGNPDDAEDAVSEVFIRVLRSWTRFRQESNVRTWIWSILRNYLTDVLRSRKRRNLLRPLEEAIDLSEPFPDTLTAEDFAHILRHLSVSERQVVHLRFIEDLSVSQTAERLGWTEAKVRVTYYRAKRVLRSLYKEEEYRSASQIKRGEEHGL